MTDDDDDTQVYKKPWVGLTDEEIYEADPLPHLMFDQQRIDFARAIEAKLKEKNT
jgi:hypothetical protein